MNREVMREMAQFLRERDETLHSLDKERILAYMQKYDIPIPSGEVVFWVGVHKAILSMASSTEEQREQSREALRALGFRPIGV